MSQAKIVNLNTPKDRPRSLPPIVHTIRALAKRQLSELLQNLFNNTDDALFELADKSQSDQHQEMYFDSMRMLRLHRQTIANNYIKSFVEYFEILNRQETTSVEIEQESFDADEYSLLDKEELEMTVAISGIVSKVTSQYSLQVMQITKRFDSLASNITINEKSCPLGPQILSTHFADALEVLDVPIKIRIILMKLFERFVMERLEPLFDTVNRAFIDAGVLPDLKGKHLLKKPAPQRAGSVASGASADGQVMVQEQSGSAGSGNTNGSGVGFNTIQQLLDGSGVRGRGATVNANLPALDPSEILAALSALQITDSQQSIDITQVPQIPDLRDLVVARTQGKKSLGPADDDTVNFVGMLFDYILNDRNLAIPMKALIGRLQIPIVKLAILDKSFFEKAAHPARTLLNELSSAGIGWSSAAELKRDALYDKIEAIVIRVLNEFSDNPDVFNELVDDLRAFVTSDSRRSVLVEQRVKESEHGKARSHEAKLRVQNLINKKACGLHLPAEIGKFISEEWSRVLTLICLRQGPDSHSWYDAVATLDDLLWMLQPLNEIEDVNKRDAQVPGLLEQITQGMDDVGCSNDEIEELQSWLQSHLEVLSNNDRSFLQDDIRPEPDTPPALIKEIVLAPPMNAEELDESSLAPEFLDTLRNITEGTWVEIDKEDNKTQRCKLATVTQPGNTYVFVNRRGMKVQELTRMSIATLLKEKRLRIVDESQVFDRALQSVIGNLRNMQRRRDN